MGGLYDNDAFLDRLEASKEGVWKVARWLSDLGHHVKVNALGKAPKVSDRYRYTDGGDLEICQRVEVKQLSASFTSAEDFPFDCVIVCSKPSWEAASPKPHAFVYLNKEGTHAAIVKGSTSASWYEIKRQPKGHPYPSEFLATFISGASFVCLAEKPGTNGEAIEKGGHRDVA